MNARTQAIAARDAEIEASTQRAVAARQAEGPRRMSAMESMSLRLGVNEKELTAALTSTVFKECKSQAQFLALVVVANEYRLNPLTKEIYAFPVKGGNGVVPMVSVDGWITLMNSHPMFDGIEFEYHTNDKGDVFAIESIIYRKDRSRPIKTIEYMDECRRNTDPWNKSARRMLRHRALIQGARIAFGFSGIYAQGDEDDGVIDGQFTMVDSKPSILPSAFETSAPVPGEADNEDEVDTATGEILPTDPTTGMTEVDEETARALDAGEPEQEDDTAAAAEETVQAIDGPLDPHRGKPWAEKRRELLDRFANAEEGADLTAANKEFERHYVSFPEDIQAELNAAYNAARRRVRGEA